MSEEFSSLPPLPERAPLGLRIRQWFRDFVRYSRPREPPPPRGNHLDRAAYGAAQPLLGLRLVFSSREIFREAIEPSLWMAAACTLVAAISAKAPESGGSIWLERLKVFYATFAVLAAAPSVIFANHYARFAAQVRFQLGFGVCGPREMPLTTSVRRLAQQSILVWVTLLPFAWLGKLFFDEENPIRNYVGGFVALLWGLNWVVLEAFDDANVLQPGQTLADVEEEAEHLRRPWFVRMFRWLAERTPARLRFIKGILRRFGNAVDRLSKPWREESALLESSPKLASGFALSTFALLAIPGLNLLFRPVIIAGATHLLGHIEQDQHAELPEVLHEHDHAPPIESAKELPLGKRYPSLGRRFDKD